MATRSTISLLLPDNTVRTIYCHWDGYLDNNGKLLLNHYNTEDKVKKLLALGDISSLGETPDPTLSTHSFETPQQDVCIAYGRDRGESDVEAKDSPSFDDAQKEEFNYLFKNGKWYYAEDESTVLKKVPLSLKETKHETS